MWTYTEEACRCVWILELLSCYHASVSGCRPVPEMWEIFVLKGQRFEICDKTRESACGRQPYWSPTVLWLEFYISQHCVVVRHVIVHARLPRVKMCGILECQDFHIILRFPLRANMATSEEWRGGGEVLWPSVTQHYLLAPAPLQQPDTFLYFTLRDQNAPRHFTCSPPFSL